MGLDLGEPRARRRVSEMAEDERDDVPEGRRLGEPLARALGARVTVSAGRVTADGPRRSRSARSRVRVSRDRTASDASAGNR